MKYQVFLGGNKFDPESYETRDEIVHRPGLFFTAPPTTTQDLKDCPLGTNSGWKSHWDPISWCFVFKKNRRQLRKKEVFLTALKQTTITHSIHEDKNEFTIWLEI